MGIFEEDYKKNEHKLKMLYGTFFCRFNMVKLFLF